MRLLLDGLARYGPEERLPAVAEHLALLEAAAEPHFRAPAERTLVARPDRLGLGGAGPDWV